jgi:hypothetical protein
MENYTTQKTGYSKKSSVWNFLVKTERPYNSPSWAKKRAQGVANATGHAHGVVSLNGTFRVIRDHETLKPQHRDCIFQPR